MSKTIYTGGTFDLFHRGHVLFLKRCSLLGRVVVALNTDEFIEDYKGKPPVISYEERKAVLEACQYVDEVVENFGGWDSKSVIEAVDPDVVAIGTDWAVKDYYSQMGFTQQWLDDNDICLVYIPNLGEISSTKVKERMQ